MSRPPSRSPQRRPQGSGGGQRPADSKQHVLHFLFDRPAEPVFLPKGDENAVFDLPSDFIAEEYRPAREGLINRIKDEISENIPVKRITVPDGSAMFKIGRRDNFSLFIPSHRTQAATLIKILVGMRTYDDFLSAAVYFRDRTNPQLYNYALSVAILHRPDTNHVNLPPLFESFPDKYIDGAVFKRAREVSNVLEKNARFPIEIPRDYTASDMEPEHKIAYFREDIGVNLHHWHWHLVYPFDAPRNIVDKDRRGELFYYMHQQIMSRYNFERLCNGMARVERLTNFRQPIAEGYFSKLDSLVSSRVWMPRHANAYLSDINRELDQIKFDLSDLERWRDRILDSIAQGAIVDENGKRVELDETSGIDILGNIVESSILSRNRNYYGDFHNFGHLAISLCHDPDGREKVINTNNWTAHMHRHLETFSVMGDPATAMRDPVFYKWHAYIDYVFQQHKNTLPPYSQQTLDYPGVRITSLEVNSGGRKNELNTFWDKSNVNLSRGIDFIPRGNVFARINHLQHQNFNYRITVENNSGQVRNGTARIFMAPKMDERGVPWLFVDQRHMFIELDKFPVSLRPNQNVIERKSTDSSVTIPFEATFRNLDQGRPSGGSGLEQFNFCGCGWPQHMLIPKGAPRGFMCELFVMISNIEGDRVEQSDSRDGNPCNIAESYCGIRDKKYPDRRAMGFPFDRNPRDNVDTLRDFLTSNMAVTDVRIVFKDRKDSRTQNEIRSG